MLSHINWAHQPNLANIPYFWENREETHVWGECAKPEQQPELRTEAANPKL